MNEFALARVIHVLAVVHWIGGVAMITTVVIPIIRKSRSDAESVELFEAIEKKFAASQDRDSHRRWYRLLHARFHRRLEPVFRATVLVDPCNDHRLGIVHVRTLGGRAVVSTPPVQKACANEPAKDILVRADFPMIMLTLSLVTIAGAVAGSHGWLAT